MDLRHLMTFQTVLKEGSFLAASRALRLAQPTVTLHIQELEAELGMELFDRRGRRRVRTAAGDLLATRALPLLDAVETLERSMAELRDGQSGLLRIGAVEPAASRRVMPLLAQLCRERPRLRVHLEASGTGGVSRGVMAGELEIGLCSQPPVELGLTFEPLYEEEIAALVPRAHRLARRRPLRAAHLAGEPLLLTDQGCAYRSAVESALAGRGVDPRWALESGSTASLSAAVQHGVGIALLPVLAVSPAPPGTVIRRLSDVAIHLRIGLVTRPDAAPATSALATLVAVLRAALAMAGPGRAAANRQPRRPRSRAAG